MKDKDYCDHCGKVIPTGKAYAVTRLPVDVDSANAGESAILCGDCYHLLKIESFAERALGSWLELELKIRFRVLLGDKS